MRKVKVFERSWPQGYNKKCKKTFLYEGLFHCWGNNYEEFEDGIGNYSIAIVELSDGTVITPNAEEIVFISEETNL